MSDSKTPRRRCDACEYSRCGVMGLNCYFNPPVKGDNFSGGFPTISESDFCSKWEPKWKHGPLVQEAWEQFLVAYKLIVSGENNK